MEYHKAHGRRKAGSWGTPHKGLRQDANQATRTLTHREERQIMAEHWSFANDPTLPPGEPIKGKTYRADGWQYVDTPARLSHEMRNEFLSIIGDGNYRILAQTFRIDDWRGQLLISPEGQERMKAHAEKESTGVS